MNLACPRWRAEPRTTIVLDEPVSLAALARMGCGIGPRFIRADGRTSSCAPFEEPTLIDGEPHCPHCLGRAWPGPNMPPPGPPEPPPVTSGTYR